LEMAFTHSHINAFVIVGGDSDFITLVEKLKQYDRKVFVVGGRSFTSQVMQKNCTEFIAYENVVPDRRPSQPRADRGAERQRTSGTMSIDQAVPLLQRALKVLTDREVSPQLGLLKSTLLQLDSSFSERDYGVGSFRDFAEKLAQHGLVTLKHQGRSTLVEWNDGGSATPAVEEHPEPLPSQEATEEPSVAAQPSTSPARSGPDAASLGDGVALVRRALAEAQTPPRWPMYPRQFKQFLRTFQPDFDERRYGSIADLMRACQKDGILRLERDRQGVLRVFANSSTSRGSLPHGWGLVVGRSPEAQTDDTGEESVGAIVNTTAHDDVAVVNDEPAATPVAAEVPDTPIDAPASRRKRAARSRKTTGGSTQKSASTRKRRAPAEPA
ncbi:MAG: NYN domain-containing protein, partial [Vicinamibacterales bacterium]